MTNISCQLDKVKSTNQHSERIKVIEKLETRIYRHHRCLTFEEIEITDLRCYDAVKYYYVIRAPEGFDELLKHAPNADKITIISSALSDSSDYISNLKKLSKFEKLKCLDIAFSESNDISEIQNLEYLETLNLATTSKKNINLDFSKFKQLKELELICFECTDFEASIFKIKSLEKLVIHGFDKMQFISLEGINKLKLLKELEIYTNDISLYNKDLILPNLISLTLGTRVPLIFPNCINTKSIIQLNLHSDSLIFKKKPLFDKLEVLTTGSINTFKDFDISTRLKILLIELNDEKLIEFDLNKLEKLQGLSLRMKNNLDEFDELNLPDLHSCKVLHRGKNTQFVSLELNELRNYLIE